MKGAFTHERNNFEKKINTFYLRYFNIASIIPQLLWILSRTTF